MSADVVRGTIIGDFYITGTLHNKDGVQQGPRFNGDTDEEVKTQALDWIKQAGGKAIYPNGLELRLRP